MADFHISGYTISHREVVCTGGSEVTLYHLLRTRSEGAAAQDLAGLFHVPKDCAVRK